MGRAGLLAFVPEVESRKLSTTGRVTTRRSQYSDADGSSTGDIEPVIRSALDTGGSLARWCLCMASPRVDTSCQSPTLDAVALTHISMPNTPTYILYHGRNTGKDKAGKKIWTRIGAVWPNKSGKGFNLTWDYVPLGDGITVMLPFDKDDANASPSEV